MTVRTVRAAYFSPAGTTRKITCHISKYMAHTLNLPICERDFTLPGAREEPLLFDAEELVVFGVPVYAGRVPNVLLKYLPVMRGCGAAAVPVVLYGNRNYDDALIELRNLLEESGFHTIGGAAFIGEHAFSGTLAAGRPDESDLRMASEFAMRIAAALTENTFQTPVPVRGETCIRPYYQPRGADGAAIDIRKVRPKVYETCISCGLCARVCPMGSIDPGDVRNFRTICIKCGACIKQCPVGARYYDDADYLFHKEDLERQCRRRAQPELFL